VEAARRSATIADRRILRVLDAEARDGVCYVVNEWATGTSLDIMVSGAEPLGARRAAWMISEVADTIAGAHAVGIAHGRLVPENILVDRTGAVRVIGFSVDAALHGLLLGQAETDPIATDVCDVAGLLYCALTGKWAGVSDSKVEAAPTEHGQLLRPRQVRAGVPRTLDAICEDVLGSRSQPRGSEHRELTGARAIADLLAEFVGDTTGMAEAMAADHPPSARERTVVLSPAPDFPLREKPFPAAPEVVSHPEVEPHPEVEADADPEGPPEPEHPPELPTEAGLPIFKDESDDVSWLTARSTPAPPPPPFEEPPERPLFATETVRRPRPGSEGGADGQEYWPWDTGTGRPGATTGTGLRAIDDDGHDSDEDVPGRSWLRLAAAVMAGLLLLVAIVVAYNLGRGKTPLGTEPEDDGAPTTTSSPSETPSVEATPLTGLVATDFDPQGDPPEENSDGAPLAVDGDPATSWATVSYNDQLGPGGLKTGVGLTIDLGTSTTVTSVELTMVGAPTGVALYLSEDQPVGVRDLSAAATDSVAAGGDTIELEKPATGRFLTVWLTSLPAVGSQFRGEVAEVEVRGG